MSSKKEMEYLTTEIGNATELESMVFNKIIDTPGIQAEIAATQGRETDFGDADLGVLQMQLSHEHDSDEEDELPINISTADSNSKITQQQKDKDKKEEDELDQLFNEIAEEADEAEQVEKAKEVKKQKQRKESDHKQMDNITAKEKEREALRVKAAIMNNEITPTPDPNETHRVQSHTQDREESTGSDNDPAQTPPTSDPNPEMSPQMTNTLHSASTYFSKKRDTLGGEHERMDTRVSTILSEDGSFDESQTVFTKGELKFIKNVLKCCTAENGFDLYQLMAFDGAKGTKSGCWSYLKYYIHMIKAILCAMTQIFGMLIIMIDIIQRGYDEKELPWNDICNPPDYDHQWYIILYRSNLKILAFLFSSFLAYFSIDALMGVEQGMYKKMKYAHTLKWVNVKWLRIGFSVNVFVSIIAVYGSFIVIFFSDNSLDMVLNSVALFFIVELDDILVKQDDYERIHDHILDYSHQDPNADLEEKKHCVGCRRYYRCCCSKMMTCFAWLYTLPFTILRYVTILACVVLPVFVGYCY